MVDLLATYRVPCGLYVRKRKPIIIALFSCTLVSSLRSWCSYSAGWMFSCGSLASLRWGLESTLPIPQFMTLVTPFQALCTHCAYLSSSSNYKQKSLYGFRMSTLIGWVGGDSFKYSHPSTHARLQTGKFMIFSQDGLLFRTREPSPIQDLCSFPTVCGHR